MNKIFPDAHIKPLIRWLALGTILLFPIAAAQGQDQSTSPVMVSSDSLFQDDNRRFNRSDTLYVRIVVPQIDFYDLKESEYSLTSLDDEEELEGDLVNHLDGVFTAQILLAKLDSPETRWTLICQIEDDSGIEFKAEIGIQILDGEGLGALTLTAAIDSIAADTLFIAGTAVVVGTNTAIFDDRGDPLTSDHLAVGGRVEISALQDSLGSIIATQIAIFSPRNLNEIELTGLIQEIADSTVLVDSLRFVINHDSEIMDHDGDSIPLNDLAVGQFAEVKAFRQDDSTRVVNRIRLETEDSDEIEVVGLIDSVSDSALVVNGIMFAITGQVEVFDEEEESIKISVLVSGFIAEVQGREGAGGYEAQTIEIKQRLAGPGEFSLKGLVSSVTSDTLVVAGIPFIIDSTTIIQNDQGLAKALPDVRPGDGAELTAEIQPSGEFRATTVIIFESTRDRLEVAGQIDSLRTDLVFVLGIPFSVSDSTVVMDDDDNPASLANLAVGIQVEVSAVRGDSAFHAVEIEIEDPFLAQIEFTGTIERLVSDSLLVSGAAFLIGPNTTFFDRKDNPLTLLDFAVGQIVEIIALRQLDGSLLASQIRLLERIEDEIEVVGRIEAIVDSVMTVLGEEFIVTPNTEILDAQEVAIGLAALSTGQIVQIRGDLLPGNTRIAHRIKLEGDETQDITVVGPIDSLSMGSLVVLGIAFVVDDSTEFVNDNGDPMALDSLRIGQTVEVTALSETDGTRRATRVELEDVLVVFGKIDQIDEHNAVIANVSFKLSPDIVILSANNIPQSKKDLHRDQILELRAHRQAGDALVATRIKIHAQSSVSTVGTDGVNVPMEFQLGNYPNPFNPETTILFEIPIRGDEIKQTRLTIFNVIGQKIRTLLDQRLGPGIHKRIWDGRDSNGKMVPSGVYAYQLTVGDFKVSRLMTLLK